MSIEDIKRRLAAATPGPWEAHGLAYNTTAVLKVGERKSLARLGDPLDRQTWRDAVFIAHAPEDIAWLLGEVERQRSRAKFYENAAARVTRELNAFADAHEQCFEGDS